MKVEINVPSSLSEITLEQYQKFVKVNTEENKDTSFLMHKTVEIFCNMDLKDIAKIKMTSVKEILDHLNQVFEVQSDLIPRFTLGGVEYGFITQLDEMTLGEYIDLDENMSDWETMHKAMGVLFRPVIHQKGDRYKIKEYDGTEDSDKLKLMPLKVVMGSMVFFWNLKKELLQTTLNYLKKETMNNNMEAHRILQENMDGIQVSMDFLKEMFPSLTLSLN
jgi:hypothetical protein